MSNVQLSSSALERLMARRTFPLQKRTSVCRNLFGPVDHDELHRDMKDTLREISERDQERWNFNFELNSPLDGVYEWEGVSVGETPVFYRDSVQSGRTRVPATPVKGTPADEPVLPETPGLTGMERLSAPETPSAPSTTETNQENRKDKLNSGARAQRAGQGAKRSRADTTDTGNITGNNSHITDFFKRKRVVDRKPADVSSCHQSSKSPIPQEQTPRKRIR